MNLLKLHCTCIFETACIAVVQCMDAGVVKLCCLSAVISSVTFQQFYLSSLRFLLFYLKWAYQRFDVPGLLAWVKVVLSSLLIRAYGYSFGVSL